MGRRGQYTSFQERVTIAERAAAGQSDPQIAAEVGCSVATVRKWRRRFRDQGRDSLASQMGRPAIGALGTHTAELKQTVRRLREQHPGWGPDTLLVELRQDPQWKSQPLPSRARVAAFLKAERLTRRYQRHTELPQPVQAPLQTAHAEWQLDAQGVVQVEGVGKTSMINILDRISRLKVESYPCVGRSKPATEDYYLALRRAFLTYGLPERLSLDHDTVFFDNRTPSPFPTRLHLWLIALGADVSFIRKPPPANHAEIERTHQLMEAQTLTGQQWSSQPALWAALDHRREILNTVFPTRALDGHAPLESYPAAITSGRPYRPEWEEDLLSLDRLYHYLAQGRWFRYNHRGRIQLGACYYHLHRGYLYDRQTMEITFDPDQVAFRCRPEKGTSTISVPAIGLTKAMLMGDAATLLALPSYQLALPFSMEERRRLELIACLTATTL